MTDEVNLVLVGGQYHENEVAFRGALQLDKVLAWAKHEVEVQGEDHVVGLRKREGHCPVASCAACTVPNIKGVWIGLYQMRATFEYPNHRLYDIEYATPSHIALLQDFVDYSENGAVETPVRAGLFLKLVEKAVLATAKNTITEPEKDNGTIDPAAEAIRTEHESSTELPTPTQLWPGSL